jgi:hypothetical protein
MVFNLGVRNNILTGYVKLKTYFFVKNVKQSGPDLWLTTGDSDVKTFD